MDVVIRLADRGHLADPALVRLPPLRSSAELPPARLCLGSPAAGSSPSPAALLRRTTACSALSGATRRWLLTFPRCAPPPNYRLLGSVRGHPPRPPHRAAC